MRLWKKVKKGFKKEISEISEQRGIYKEHYNVARRKALQEKAVKDARAKVFPKKKSGGSMHEFFSGGMGVIGDSGNIFGAPIRKKRRWIKNGNYEERRITKVIW